MNKSTKVFYGLIFLVLILQCYKFFLPKFFLKNQLLANDSFLEWGALQTVPSMYNYSNAIWVSDFPYNKQELNDIRDGLYDHSKIQVNHYPLRVISFNNSRDKFFPNQPGSFYVQSSFRGITILRAYQSRLESDELIIELKSDDRKE